MRSVLGLGVVSVTLRDSVDRLRREIFEIDDDDLTEFSTRDDTEESMIVLND